MIRVFSATEKDFSTNGNVILRPFKASIRNQLNGDFTLDVECPSEYADYINANDIIVVPTPSKEQAFRIRIIEKNKKRIIFKAWHVYYDGDNLLIADSTATDMSGLGALQFFNSQTDNPSPFTMISNVSKIASYQCVREPLTNCIAKVLEIWDGKLVRDNWNIGMFESIEHDYGVTVRYGKNLEDMTATYDWSSVCTKVLPVGRDNILLDDLYVYAEHQYDIPFTKTVSFTQDNIKEEDYKDAEGNVDTERYRAALKADLRAQAVKYLSENDVPYVNYTMSGRPEKVTDLGDVIEVIDERIGVRLMTQVVAYDFDCITERFNSLEFGNFKKSLADVIKDIVKK